MPGVSSLTVATVIFAAFLVVTYTTVAGAPGTDDPVIVPVIALSQGPEALPARLTTTVLAEVGDETPVAEVLDAVQTGQSGETPPETTAQITPPPPPQAPVASSNIRLGPIENVNLTFYDCAVDGFCEHMYNGEWVYEGAAACSWDMPIGTEFYIPNDPTERVYVCKDRGLLPDTWVDIFWYYPSEGYVWQSYVGRYGTIHIVYLP